jgi:hypothetical protein
MVVINIHGYHSIIHEQKIFMTTMQQTGLAELANQYCNLRASMSCFNDYIDSERIINTAMEIDQEYENWGKTCPLQFIYQTVTLQERHEEVSRITTIYTPTSGSPHMESFTRCSNPPQ